LKGIITQTLITNTYASIRTLIIPRRPLAITWRTISVSSVLEFGAKHEANAGIYYIRSLLHKLSSHLFRITHLGLLFIHDPAACAQSDLTAPSRSVLYLVYMVFAGACFAFASVDQTSHKRMYDDHCPRALHGGVWDCLSLVVGHDTFGGVLVCIWELPQDTNFILFTALRNSRIHGREDQDHGSLN
jgi:hypothetical protein